MANNEKSKRIFFELKKEADKLATITGLPVATCLESINILIVERKKGKTLDDSIQVANAFLNEKRQLLCTTITTAAQE